MIITRKYARKLIKEKKAEVIGTIEGGKYVCINRYDIQRTDHYKPSSKDSLTIINGSGKNE